MNPEDWPEVPKEDRPRSLWVDQNVPADVRKGLAVKGWKVKDIRLLKNAKDAILALLEGVRMGTIQKLNVHQLKFLELEARVTGASKGESSEKATALSDKTLEDLLGVGAP